MRKAFLIQPKSNTRNDGVTETQLNDILHHGGRTLPKQGPEDYAKKLSVLARCVSLRAGDISNLPRQIEDAETGEVLATANFDQPELDENGRPLTEDHLPFEIDLSDLLYRTEFSLCVYGAAYSLMPRNRIKNLGLRWLDTVMVQPTLTTYKPYKLDYFTYDNDPIPVEDMCYIWLPGLRELAPGTPPAVSASLSAGLVFNADTFVSQFFENGAMPVTLVMSDDDPGEPEKNRIKAYLSNAMRGVLNAFNIEVLGAKLDIKQLTPPLKDLDLSPTADRHEKGICIAMGIPFTLLFSGVGKYSSSSASDDLHYYRKTIIPEARLIEGQLNKQFFLKRGMRLRFRPDLLEMFQKVESEKVNAFLELFREDAIDVNELRQAGGLSALTPEEIAYIEAKRNKRRRLGVLGSAAPSLSPLAPAEKEEEEVIAEDEEEKTATAAPRTPRPSADDKEDEETEEDEQGLEEEDEDEEEEGKGKGKAKTQAKAAPRPSSADSELSASDLQRMLANLTISPKVNEALRRLGVSLDAIDPSIRAANVEEELRKWRIKLAKATKTGKPAADVPFTSDILTANQMSAIRYALRSADTPEAVGLALESAVKVNRDDNPTVGNIEAEAIREILAAFQAQLEAVEAVDGGRTVDIIVGKMTAAVQSHSQPLEAAVFRLVYQTVQAGMVNAVASIPAEMGITVDWGLLSSEAQSFAQTYSFNLVTELNATTEKGLREVLLQWIEEGGTMDDLTDSIRPIFANQPATLRINAKFSVERARMIAETEATRAYAQGKVDAWTKSGAAENPPDEVPPAHVRCRCDVHMIRLEDGSWWWRWYTANDELVCEICSPYITKPLLNMARRAPSQRG